ncbi:uncharacterized protein LAESUDRAFT_721047 [Laetiporus sulphureus 93-53]|uniref:Autophagy-related protein 27 n=1 Tax=Laetiporus sulphureus 93-53 TaxID=1314785 RepID=A0A165GR03_9APHY|nr:uncharacterized protein LAESUDRAFT_721047 [Laetiporus sulphureus 93-53]KZT10686.1 hypothetical protein LAESUDRAFT_721047 [Laetiporus sulphureus 93-53]
MVIARKRALCSHAMALLLFSSVVHAQDDSGFDCHISLDNVSYDLTPLAGEQSITRERSTPPTTMVDTVRFNLCANLQQLGEVDEKDQCPAGTRACLTKTNRKGDEGDRIVAVIPLATSSGVEYSTLSSPKGLSLTFQGPSYPTSRTSDPLPQSFHLRLLCATDDSEPSFLSYDGSQMSAEWSTPAACGSSDDGSSDKPNEDAGEGDDKSKTSIGSGVGYFFLLLFLALLAYFGLGAYYNYTTYGASGMDLIPHRDFWREVPYMLRDVVSHLCSAVRPRQSASRGGYIAV